MGLELNFINCEIIYISLKVIPSNYDLIYFFCFYKTYMYSINMCFI